jgi:hypothetical protein
VERRPTPPASSPASSPRARRNPVLETQAADRFPTRARAAALQREGVASVIAFTREDDAAARHRKKPFNAARDARRRFVHQRFRRDAAGECRLFRSTHLGGAEDRRDHTNAAFVVMN